MIAWVLSLFGMHWCHKFTKWERYSAEAVRTNMLGDTAEVTLTWQERSCTDCGKLFQEEIRY